MTLKQQLAEAHTQNAALRAELETARQAFIEIYTARKNGPGWFTKGLSGQQAHIEMWLRKGRAATDIINTPSTPPSQQAARYLAAASAVDLLQNIMNEKMISSESIETHWEQRLTEQVDWIDLLPVVKVVEKYQQAGGGA